VTEAAQEQSLLAQIQAAQRARRRSFRSQFTLVWVVVLVALAAALVATDNVDTEWIKIWAPLIVGSAGTTIVVCITSIALAVILAVLGAFGRLAANPLINGLASLYVSFVRGTPLLVQIYFIYFALPSLGIILPALPAGIIALGFNYGAYLTEIFRAGIQAVPGGQREAASALGMPEFLIMRRVVLPQATRIVTPAIGNEFVAMIKDSALVSIIGVREVLWNAQTAGRPHGNTLEAFIIAALVYWVLTIIFSFFQERLEKRLARGDR
jgi:polar amino acid transport system permease protein